MYQIGNLYLFVFIRYAKCNFHLQKNPKNEEHYCQFFHNNAMALTVLITFSWAQPTRAVPFLQMGDLKQMKSKRDIRSQKLFLTDACILYLFDK